MNTTIVILSLGWIACGVLAYGYSFSFFRNEYADIANHPGALEGDRRIARTMGIAGYVGLAIVLATVGIKHGLKFRT